MVDLESFVVSAEFGPLVGGASYDAIIDSFGECDLEESERRSFPMTLIYGDIEFRLRGRKLTGISLALPHDRPVNGGKISLRGFWSVSRRSLDAVGELLDAANVSWRLDEVMSRINPDEGSQVWLTQRNVHLGFFEGVLERVAADYEILAR